MWRLVGGCEVYQENMRTRFFERIWPLRVMKQTSEVMIESDLCKRVMMSRSKVRLVETIGNYSEDSADMTEGSEDMNRNPSVTMTLESRRQSSRRERERL